MNVLHPLTRFAPLAVLFGLFTTAPAYAELGDQLAKLLPDDGAANEGFGGSVAISGTTAPSSGPSPTTTTATNPARPTSLMLPPPECARGTLMTTAALARPICSRCS
ncbi:MAG: FG-GAP repeat protein [Phycisphaerales bacterium]